MYVCASLGEQLTRVGTSAGRLLQNVSTVVSQVIRRKQQPAYGGNRQLIGIASAEHRQIFGGTLSTDPPLYVVCRLASAVRLQLPPKAQLCSASKRAGRLIVATSQQLPWC